jgi:molybdopterin-guanine dinucleotide biosynthesis protein A
VGFVLAGGQSSRMGEDKALVQFAGQPLVAHALETLRQAGLTVSLAGGGATLAHFAPLIEDSDPGLGPLGGVCAALASTDACLAVFLPVDLPLLPTSLIAYLLRHARVTGRSFTVSSIHGFTQTFPVVIDRRLLPALKKELVAGRAGCLAAFRAASENLGEPMTVVPVEMLVQSGQAAHPEGTLVSRWFLNVNTPEALLRAQEYTGPRHRVS